MSSTSGSSEAFDTFTTATGAPAPSASRNDRSRSLPRSRADSARTPNSSPAIATASASPSTGRSPVMTESTPRASHARTRHGVARQSSTCTPPNNP